jgi:hypothetical protein
VSDASSSRRPFDPLKQQPITGGGKAGALATGFFVNGAWGLGTALFFGLFGGRTKRLLL